MQLHKLLLALALFLTSFGYAQSSYCNCCPDYEIYGDYLYWRARRCELDYAIDFTGSVAQSDTHDVIPSYSSGFRVGIMTSCGCLDYEARYTYYRTDATNKVTNANGDLAGTRIVADSTVISQGGDLRLAKGTWDLDYDLFDLIASYHWRAWGCIDSNIFGGFTYLHLDQTFDILYATQVEVSSSADINEVHQTIDVNAFGLNLGLDGSYNLCGCFDLFGSFSYNILLGHSHRQFKYNTIMSFSLAEAELVNLKKNCWRAISAFNLAFGLSYFCEFNHCCCQTFGLSAGYEFHHYVNLDDFIAYVNQSSATITFIRNLDSLGFDGLFVRLTIGF